MREILFRGKRLDNGEWVTSSCLAKVETESDETIWYIGAGNPALIGFDENGNIRASATQRDCTHYKVNLATVGQYTGLQDKNGKQIFEGDICDFSILGNDHTTVEISIQHGAVGFDPVDYEEVCPEDREWCSFWRSDERTMWKAEYFSIIGNIHDNPELLEGGRDE